MTDFLSGISLFPLVLTLGSYQIGLWCQKKTRSALCNPLLIASLLCIGVLLLFGIDPQVYQTGTAGISWLLTPATVCLAVPLYEQLKVLKSAMVLRLQPWLAVIIMISFSIMKMEHCVREATMQAVFLAVLVMEQI